MPKNDIGQFAPEIIRKSSKQKKTNYTIKDAFNYKSIDDITSTKQINLGIMISEDSQPDKTNQIFDIESAGSYRCPCVCSEL